MTQSKRYSVRRSSTRLLQSWSGHLYNRHKETEQLRAVIRAAHHATTSTPTTGPSSAAPPPSSFLLSSSSLSLSPETPTKTATTIPSLSLLPSTPLSAVTTSTAGDSTSTTTTSSSTSNNSMNPMSSEPPVNNVLWPPPSSSLSTSSWNGVGGTSTPTAGVRIVLVTGSCGSGKSTFVENAVDEELASRSCLYGSGKIDKYFSTDNVISSCSSSTICSSTPPLQVLAGSSDHSSSTNTTTASTISTSSSSSTFYHHRPSYGSSSTSTISGVVLNGGWNHHHNNNNNSNTSSEPTTYYYRYESWIQQVFTSLCQEMIIQHKDYYYCRLRRMMTHKDLQYLIHLVPLLETLYYAGRKQQQQQHHRGTEGGGKTMNDTTTSSSSSSSSVRSASSTGHNHSPSNHQHHHHPDMDNLENMKYTIRMFLRAIATPERPIVLFLDDLHWADADTISILQSITNDAEIHNVVLIGAVQKDDMKNNIDFIHWIQSISKMGEDQCTVIKLLNLTVRDVTQLLEDLLRQQQQEPEVKELANLIHSRTQGNPLHLIQFLEYLQSAHLLRYSMDTFQWIWDIAEIQNKTSVSDSVVDIVAARMDQLHREARACLQISSCLGYRFDEGTLQVVRNVIVNVPIDDISTCLDVLEEEGLIEKLPHGRFKYSHDKVHVAAMELNQDPIALHLLIGLRFLKLYTSDDKELIENPRHLFLCTNQMNLGRDRIDDPETIIRLAQLNLQAGRVTSSYSAFGRSVEYLKIGISLLDAKTRWTNQYTLCLNLYSALVVALFSAGKLEEVSEPAIIVQRNARCIDDSMQTACIVVRSLACRARIKDAITAAGELIKKLGLTLDDRRNAKESAFLFEAAKQAIVSKTTEEILSLPPMTDMRKVTALSVFGDLLMSLNWTTNQSLINVLVAQAVTLTLDYGLCQYTPLALSMMANQLMARECDIYNAARLDHIVDALHQKIPDSLPAKGRTMVYRSCLYHWRIPLSIAVDKLMECCKVAMDQGDLYSVSMMVTRYAMTYFYSGLPLGPLVDDLNLSVQQALANGMKLCFFASIPLLQCALNLTGDTRYVPDMTAGRAIDLRIKVGQDGETSMHEELTFRMQLCFYSEDMEQAIVHSNILRKSDEVGVDRSNYFYQTRLFFYALIDIWQARKNTRWRLFNGNRRKYLQSAQGYIRILHGFTRENKAINIPHKLLILNAERLSVNRKVSDKSLCDAYDQAISACTRAGFLQDAALAAHLASKTVRDLDARAIYWSRAREMYVRWGAHGVVRHIEKRKGNMSSREMFSPVTRKRDLMVKLLSERPVFNSEMFVTRRLSSKPALLRSSDPSRSPISWNLEHRE